MVQEKEGGLCVVRRKWNRYNGVMDMELWEKRPSDVPIVVLDTETTGLYPEMGHRIIEIAAIRLENWVEVGQLNTLVQPGRPIDAQASAVNGITDAELVGQPTFADVQRPLQELLHGALVVAHNAPFDAGFVGMEWAIQQWRSSASLPALTNPWLCTLQLARRHFHFGQNNLGHIALQLGVRMGRAHRAVNDAYMTAEVLKRMTKELAKRRMVSVADLLHAQGGAIYPPQPANAALSPVILQALQDGRFLRILYTSANGQSARTITPLYPTHYQGADYLIAFCHQHQEQRTFRIDRITRAELV